MARRIVSCATSSARAASWTRLRQSRRIPSACAARASGSRAGCWCVTGVHGGMAMIPPIRFSGPRGRPGKSAVADELEELHALALEHRGGVGEEAAAVLEVAGRRPEARLAGEEPCVE